MFIALFVIAVLIFVITFIAQQRNWDDYFIPWIAGTLVMIIAVGGSLVCGIILSSSFTIDDRIAMYEEANAEIDGYMQEAVENYKDYEQGTFDQLSDKSAESLLTLYPALKADTLVQEQMEVYRLNKSKILDLKEEKLLYIPTRWWLYFGH